MFLEAGLLTRRSVRNFQAGIDISQSDIEDILKIAMYAPSAYNKQSWEFVVIKSNAQKELIMQAHPYASFLKDASLAILVCTDNNQALPGGYGVLDAAAATQNLLLACHGKGFGACWCGVYPNQDIMNNLSNSLALPQNITPISLVVVGYPASTPKQPHDRFKPEKIHFDKW